MQKSARIAEISTSQGLIFYWTTLYNQRLAVARRLAAFKLQYIAIATFLFIHEVCMMPMRIHSPDGACVYIKDRSDGALETRLYMRRVSVASYQTYFLVAENTVGSTKHRVALRRST